MLLDERNVAQPKLVGPALAKPVNPGNRRVEPSRVDRRHRHRMHSRGCRPVPDLDANQYPNAAAKLGRRRSRRCSGGDGFPRGQKRGVEEDTGVHLGCAILRRWPELCRPGPVDAIGILRLVLRDPCNVIEP